ncbi:hypothetical protein [Bradyrhizobium sp. URHD0069]|uniref:hypothetical protein n=1 Tax=Bradyrhizobium sp. URHD0069 TaxID=1380355 RepID=UPI0012DC602D|nr:hypothetical protein [Bradyrhizobium sp. URHD0069]
MGDLLTVSESDNEALEAVRRFRDGQQRFGHQERAGYRGIDHPDFESGFRSDRDARG